MAYVIVTYKNAEIFRRELRGPAIVGRSPECELSIRDVLLSRRHCQIEPAGAAWVLSDMGSKNGTRVGSDTISHRILRDGDEIHLGRSTVQFKIGPFVPAPSAPGTGRLRRPADPNEALANTLSDFVLEPLPEAEIAAHLPRPQPVPREPMSYVREDVRAMVSELVSSSWDSIYEHASGSTRFADPEPVVRIRRVRPAEPSLEIMLRPPPDCGLDSEPLDEANEDMETQNDWVDLGDLGPLPSAVLAPPKVRPNRFKFLLARVAMLFEWLALAMLVWPR